MPIPWSFGGGSRPCLLDKPKPMRPYLVDPFQCRQNGNNPGGGHWWRISRIRVSPNWRRCPEMHSGRLPKIAPRGFPARGLQLSHCGHRQRANLRRVLRATKTQEEKVPSDHARLDRLGRGKRTLHISLLVMRVRPTNAVTITGAPCLMSVKARSFPIHLFPNVFASQALPKQNWQHNAISQQYYSSSKPMLKDY